MCLLKVKIKQRDNEQVLTEIAIVELAEGRLRLYNIFFEKVAELDLTQVRKMYLNSVDAYLVLELG